MNSKNYKIAAVLFSIFPGFVFIYLRDGNYLNFLIGISLAAIISIIANQYKLLTFDGSAAAFILGIYIFGLGGLKWAVPLLAFFIFSSLLSFIKSSSKTKTEIYFEKTSRRDAQQVLANGGLGLLLVIIYYFNQLELFYFAYVSTLSAVCADTWGTEFGTMKKTKTINILTFNEVEQGRSGGVSLPGTLGSVAGAAVIGLSSIYWIAFNQFHYLIFIIFAGVIGSLFDSILGATLQVQYRCNACKKITEKKFHCNLKSEYFKGVKFINNDFVNFSSAAVGGMAGVSFILLFY